MEYSFIIFIPILQASTVLDSSTGAATARALTSMPFILSVVSLFSSASGAPDGSDHHCVALVTPECSDSVDDEVSLLQTSTQVTRLASANVPTFDFAQDPLLIYQYGKVASTSLEWLGSLMIPKTFIPYIDGPQASYPRGAKIHRQDTATDFLSHVRNGSDVWVITATRSRFSRDISAFFQCLAHPFYSISKSSECFNCLHNSPFVGLEEEEIKRMTLDMNLSVLHDVFRQWWHGPDYKDDWFSRDFYDATGVNMLHHVDEIVKAHKTHIWLQQKSKDNRFNLNVILLRFEDIAHWSQILSQYFPGFKMPEENQGSDQWYGNIYQKFLKTYQFSQHEIDAICQGDTMKFYSDEERPEMCKSGRPYSKTSNGSRWLLADVNVDGFDDDSN